MKTRMHAPAMLVLGLTVVFALNMVMRSQTLRGSSLVAARRQGGYVIAIRHASSPQQLPDKKTANPDNTNLERQLDETGRTTATAMGKAVRDLKIPIGEVQSSPAYRAMETVRLAQWSNVKPVTELGDGGQSMAGIAEAQGLWLQKKVKEAPKSANTILVTHMPNLARAFPQISAVAEGEALVFHPDGKGNAPLVARIKIDEWPSLRP